MKEKENLRKGISLITLVITIIVVIVLAAAVILTLNNSNPIENAKEATFKSDISTVKDDLNLYLADKYAKSNGIFDMSTLNLSEITVPKITDELKSVENSKLKGKIEVQDGKLVYTGTDETEKKWFDQIVGQGGNTPSTPEAPVVPGEAVDKNTNYTDKNNKTAIIPKGFKVSTVVSEQEIDTGLVIIAPDESEFVWVPVPDITVCIDKANNRSILWNWSKVEGTPTQEQLNGTRITYSTTDYREPDIITDCDNNQTYLDQMNTILGTNFTEENQGFEVYMKKEWEEIYKSIELNKGFYIGRYETGNIINDDNAIVISKKDQNDLGGNGNTWYKLYAKQKKYASTLVGTSIRSNMIYGFEFDVTLKWFTTSSDINVKKYPVNADNEYANFTQDKKATGSTKAVNNVYDMSGNVYDWTAEAFNIWSRILRGSYYPYSPDSRFAGYRYLNGVPFVSDSDVYGSRLGLYL
ncbi:MAG: hypothetical protein PHP54_01335 [Clostridia bacterium]|nr:hypothetical protein [Clostridia bacterium]